MENQEIVDVIESLSKGIKDEGEKKNLSWLSNVLEEYKYIDIKDPEKLALIKTLDIGAKLSLISNIAISGLGELNIGREKHGQLTRLYENYDFIERFLKELVYKYEGMGCSTDKTRYILVQYKKYLLGEEYVKECSGKHYYEPTFTDIDTWIKYIESVDKLRYGRSDDFISCKVIIEEKYVQAIEARKNQLEEVYVKESTFVEREVEETQIKYKFKNEKDDIGTIVVDSKTASIGYLYYSSELERNLKYSDHDTVDISWFKEILGK